MKDSGSLFGVTRKVIKEDTPIYHVESFSSFDELVLNLRNGDLVLVEEQGEHVYMEVFNRDNYGSITFRDSVGVVRISNRGCDYKRVYKVLN